jgi:DNA topoisomerase-1
MGKYTLIITEKPDAAQRIAMALDEKEKPLRKEKNGVPFYVVKRDKEIVVVPALGHLYTVAAEGGKRGGYPVFDLTWVPRYAVERSSRYVRKWIGTITELARDADAFIDACDYDIEGSVIGYNVLKFACNGREQDAKRMKYSTLGKEELEKSYVNLLPHLDFAFIEAGRTRHEVDWLYGVNLSRALTVAAKNRSGRYTTISTGRVQGPTLKFIMAREKTIKSFVPTPYWEIRATIRVKGQTLEALHEKDRIETRTEADTIIQACKGKEGIVEKIDTRRFQQPPPPSFDLGSLQSEAYRLFKYSPKRTSTITQRLYLDALISYPRTSSQKLPTSIGYKKILESLNSVPQYRTLTAQLLARPELKPHEGNKKDPAHPAIYPTGKLPTGNRESSEMNLWDLVVRRFMAAFAESSIRQTIMAHIIIGHKRFQLTGTRTLEQGWMHFCEPYVKKQEDPLPDMREGDHVQIRRMSLDSRFTNPPPRYNSSSLLKKMERTKIGTKATRADIIQTLHERKYISNERITVTDLGFEVLNALENHCPTVVSIRFTRELEQEMDNIHLNQEKREIILEHTIETLKPVLEKLRENEKAIGERLSQAIEKSRMEERTLGACPTCKTGKLVVIHSRKTGKRFVGCTNYFKGACNASSPLPQRGNLKPLSRSCPNCGWPMIQIRLREKTWKLCINPQHSQERSDAEN